MTPAALMTLLASRRLPLNTERALQDAIAGLLTEARVPFERECRLGEAGIVDFRVEGTAIEIKIGGSRRAIHRQCARYCDHPDVAALILATTVSMNLPGMAKPVFVFSLGRAWL
ncbi:hypothetical protein ACQVP2_07750 [Methylobacterium aquaticum]|uniref:hypothetical protein n=1 Tax=Methylobacterium aquaticum TaxID=270351 RepID=UPI003D18745B